LKHIALYFKPVHEYLIFYNNLEAEANLSQIVWQVESTMLEEIVYLDFVYSSYSTKLANETMCFSDLHNKKYLLNCLRDSSS
jgi:hypothetical protein